MPQVEELAVKRVSEEREGGEGFEGRAGRKERKGTVCRESLAGGEGLLTLSLTYLCTN